MEIKSSSPKLQPHHFTQISQLVYRVCGIKLPQGQGKEELVKARLMKRLAALKLENFDQYLALLEKEPGGKELTLMIDALTTNKTCFFREPHHFDFLRKEVLPLLRRNNAPIRIWSAGCSSGEEPVSLSILLKENITDIARRDVRILATDLCTKVLSKAREATYKEETVQSMPGHLIQKYFNCIATEPVRLYRVADEVRAMVWFAHLNLMDKWPMQGPFDFIFCRNVMIYFDRETQRTLVHRFWQLLKPMGHLFVGHSENLTEASSEFSYVKPAIYQKLTVNHRG
jgi:chemotaxis protein methyltransferase CheR